MSNKKKSEKGYKSKEDLDAKGDINESPKESKESQKETEIEESNINQINAEEEISKLREEKLRLLAEMENLRKRSQKEKLESIKFGSANLARDILSPNDNLVRALENIPEDSDLSDPIKSLVNGLKMVQKEFNSILEKHGIKKIESLNKKFDHNLHQAMLEVETDEEEGVVVQEIQSGYILNDRLLRPAMVGVSKKAKKEEKK
tara:strand:- start:498 stop:1106 length:609 start_codon:yes stop_codon:yes gene_type:complete